MDGIREQLSVNWTTSKYLSKFLHLVTVAVCMSVAMYQVGILIDLFFKYPVTISISYERLKELEFPGVTLCTSDGISAKVIMEYNDGLYDSLVQSRKESLNLDSNASLPMYHQQEILNLVYSNFVTMTDLPDLVVKSINFTNFVLAARCASSDTGKQDCIDVLKRSLLETFQGNYMCWTMFHESQDSMSYLDEASIPAGYRQSAFMIPDKGFSFNSLNSTIEPREVVRFLVNLSASDPIQLDSDGYGIISVHDRDTIRLNRRKSLIIRPGFRYEIYFAEQVFKALQAPYKSRCYPYVVNHAKVYSNDSKCVHQFFEYPLSRSDCFYGCMAMNSVTNSDCVCYPPDIPYLRKDPSCSYDYIARGRGGGNEGEKEGGGSTIVNEKACNWVRRSMPTGKSVPEIIRVATNEFHQCFGNNEDDCMETCPMDCSEANVLTETQYVPWPSKKEILMAEGNDRQLLQHFKNCCAVVSIRYRSQYKIVYEEQPKYESVEFVSAAGGIVSLWVGFTFVGIFDYIRHSARFIFLYVCTGYGRKASEGQLRKTAKMTQKVTPLLKKTQARKTFQERMGNSSWSMEGGNDMLYDWQPKRGIRKNSSKQLVIINKQTPFPSYGLTSKNMYHGFY